MSTSTKTTRIDKAGARLTLPVAALAFVIALAVQFIGQAKIDIGIGAIVIFPMVWGLILGLLVSIQKFKPLGLDLQRIAAALVGVAVLLLVARLAFNIGPSLPSLIKAGPALLLQEVGHLLGTIMLALPLAVLLRMGKATVGATFSLDREPSFAMVSEKYGPDSDQYRGVLAMYVFGTLFGAVYITLLTSLVANWKIFDPLALAMGAGVGSGSMMAASSASIIAAYPADQEAILGMAAVSNLITTILGVYVGIYIALPLADRFYKLLTRRQTREAAAVAAGAPGAPGAPAERGLADIEREEAQAEENRRFRERVAESSAAIKLPLWLSLSVLTVLGIGTASVAAKGFSLTIVGGYGIMLALVLVSIALAKVTKKISAIVYITTIGAYISSPWFFGAESLTTVIKTVDFLSIATVMLTLAGLSLGKDIPLLKNIGWKIIPVGLVAITASFLLSTVIAEFALGLWH
ncbi:UNVERIFIED_ORG: MFS family permease [Arthrobacter sp. UYEF10]